jgi:hypothetical protein|tara:strand:- start:5473 stop:5904 length:432 start_codon:yes stop_codon:yes gene_type:complete
MKIKLKLKNIQKNNFLNFISNDLSSNFQINKNYIIINNPIKLKKNLINRLQNFSIILLQSKKIKLLDKLNILKIIFKKKTKFEKNFLLLYQHKNYLTANNVFPDWPNKYQDLSIMNSFYRWLKNFSKIIFFYSKIELIIIKKK